jgi:hypothetical protein
MRSRALRPEPSMMASSAPLGAANSVGRMRFWPSIVSPFPVRRSTIGVFCVAQPMQKLRWIERGRGPMEVSVAGVGVEVGIVA